MSSCTITNHIRPDDESGYPTKGYNSCWEWVASLPGDHDAANVNTDCNSTVEPILAGSDFIVRKRGILGLNHGGKHSATDVYQLAQATRKARDRLSVVSAVEGSGTNFRERVSQDRTAILRTAFAAQRLDRTNSEGTFSFDSSTLEAFGLCDDEDSFPSAEDLLLQMGFGGPSHGLDRVPERFLQPSQMRGVDIDQFYQTQQEMNDTFETGSLGYRGLVGPPTRRPSNIVARLYERMLRKNSGPTSCSSFEYPPGQSAEPLTLKLPHPEVLVEMEESAVTPTNPPSTSFNTNPMMKPPGSRNSSLTSSRRSSLRRQECVDLDEEPTACAEPAEDIVCQQSEQSSGFISGRMLANALLPTVYVTPPPSTVFSQASLDMPESITTHEIDPIISVLQLATEAYRVRLSSTQKPATEETDACDWNHNLDDVKEELRIELDKTDDLLQRLQQRLSHARSIHQSYDSSALRGVLTDMTTLLQQQQRLYRRVNEARLGQLETSQHFHVNHLENIVCPTPAKSTTEQLSSSQSSTNVSSCANDVDDDQHFGKLWLRLFERRLTAQIRKTVRQELRRARPILARSKLKKNPI
ncbi:uncharacterized protein LOC116933195 isoform X1 [Daphnia magna]|uniref:uncharacterized protein LOC116933195 isoform X1 n=1 Tax=Daphnia magna TaxID=35525 RepID=UPI001E1BBE0E|nr:uncharacterized protein LOC116933195 isoform X1 [Daphnia magna]XP_045034254.1 uncharacterized protein LOC116933195 isoform X1 [Daphnia magna]XP_045034255.1 uncharacterized protein LOC116933195 isoform X1 [Daphnia magna]